MSRSHDQEEQHQAWVEYVHEVYSRACSELAFLDMENWQYRTKFDLLEWPGSERARAGCTRSAPLPPEQENPSGQSH